LRRPLSSSWGIRNRLKWRGFALDELWPDSLFVGFELLGMAGRWMREL
jgi:hypothetical protein